MDTSRIVTQDLTEFEVYFEGCEVYNLLNYGPQVNTMLYNSRTLWHPTYCPTMLHKDFSAEICVSSEFLNGKHKMANLISYVLI